MSAIDTARTTAVPPQSGGWGLPVLATGLAGLVAVSLYNYAVFHTLVEAFCVLVAGAVFIVVFNTRHLHDNDYLLFVGLGFVTFVALGIPHTLGYKGLALFPGFDDDLPTQAFIAQRFFIALSFIIAPAYLRRRINVRLTIAILLTVTVLVLASLLVWRNFPSMFVTGEGLTGIKKAMEVVLALMFLVAAGLMLRNREHFESHVANLITASLACFVGSEVAFMLYKTPFGISNLVGHLLQVSAFWLIYRAVLLTGLARPFDLLYRKLATSEAELARANLHLQAVGSISDAAITTLELRPIVNTLLDRLCRLMSADAAVLLTVADEHLETLATVGMEDVFFRVHIGEGFSGRIAGQRAPEVVRDASTDPRMGPDPLRETSLRTIAGAPLVAGDTLLGVLHVGWLAERDVEPQELELLQAGAERFSMALRNAQMYEGERHVAQVLQESLLALPESISGLQFATAYRAAMQSARVGGDFYDIFDIDSVHVGIVIGDVSGKGLEAAAITSLVRNTIRANSLDECDPATVLRAANTITERSTDPSTFATVFFGVLDRCDGSLSYVNAGHTTAGLLRVDGSVCRLEANSPIMGAFPDTPFASSETLLNENDMLFLYTDGLTEAGETSDQYGEERLFTRLADLAAEQADPDELIQDIVDGVMAFAGNILRDDVALLVLRWTATHVRGCTQDRLDWETAAATAAGDSASGS